MGDLVSAIIGLATGLLAGFATGFYFEKRASRSLRTQAAEQNRQLSALKTILFSMGASPRETEEQVTSHGGSDLTSRVTARALATQDAAGRVRRAELVAYFAAQGEHAADVESAMQSLCNVGRARENGEWLQMS